MAEQPITTTETAAGPPERPPVASPPVKAAVPDPRIEDYLDHVCAPLVGLVPYARRQELRAELRGHLEALAATHEELGSGREAAILLALRQFGMPRHVSRLWAREWAYGVSAPRLQPAWPSMLLALGSFGLTTLLAVALLAAVMPAGGIYLSSYPEVVMVGVVGILLPAMAGMISGLLAPARHVLGTFFALALLSVPSAGLALHVLTHSVTGAASAIGLALGLVQPLLWIPVGCATAALGGWMRARLMLWPRRWVLQ